MKGCGLRLHRMGECGAHPEPPLLLTLRHAWRVFLKHVATDKCRKFPKWRGTTGKHGRSAVWPRRPECSQGQRKRFPPVCTQRGDHPHRKIKAGKHVDYFVEEQVVTEKS